MYQQVYQSKAKTLKAKEKAREKDKKRAEKIAKKIRESLHKPHGCEVKCPGDSCQSDVMQSIASFIF